VAVGAQGPLFHYLVHPAQLAHLSLPAHNPPPLTTPRTPSRQPGPLPWPKRTTPSCPNRADGQRFKLPPPRNRPRPPSMDDVPRAWRRAEPRPRAPTPLCPCPFPPPPPISSLFPFRCASGASVGWPTPGFSRSKEDSPRGFLRVTPLITGRWASLLSCVDV